MPSVGGAAVPVEYSPLDPEVVADPYPVYARLRARAPVHWSPYFGAWTLTRYRDCRDVLADHRLFARDQRRIGRELAADQESIQAQDPPEQAALRSRLIDAVKVQDLEAICERAADRLGSELVAQKGPFDAMTLAGPIALQISSELVGVEGLAADVYPPIFRGLTRQMDGAVEPARIAEGEAASAALRGLVEAQFELDSTTGVIGALRPALERGEFPFPYVRNTVGAVFNAAYSTVYAVTGSVLLAFFDWPQEFTADPHPSWADELIRYTSPAQGTSRVAVRPTQLGEVEIAAGETVVTLIAAANRDPEVFPEPDRLVLGRSGSPHLGFGWGPHLCAGTRPARLWVGHLARLLHRFHGRLRAAGQPRHMQTATLRCLECLPISVE